MRVSTLAIRDPFAGWLSLRRDVDRALGEAFHSEWGHGGSPVLPAVDIEKDDDGIALHAEVPGVDLKALEVSVDGRDLTISGERSESDMPNGNTKVRERHFGKFSRTFRLSEDSDTSKVAAEYKNGVLTVRVPKHPEAKPRQIQITAS